MMSTTGAVCAVTATGLSVAYGDHVALRDVSFELPRAGVTAIIGPNGSGKTTLLRAISGLEEPTAGTVEVLGTTAGRHHDEIAHVMQATKVNDAVPLTVTEVVRMGRYAQRGVIQRFRRADREAVEHAIDRMDIADIADRQLHDLSGGQQQRVFVAQGLAQQADVLLLDEPVSGLDVTSQDRIQRAIDEEVGAGRTVVLTTHDVATAAASDHVLLLATHLVAAGGPDEVLVEEHLEHAYGPTSFRTAEGVLIIGDPHTHGTVLHGHQDH